MTLSFNFSLPIDLSCLENDRLKLVPLEENLPQWAALYVADANLHPQVYTYLTYGPFASAEEYMEHYDSTSRSNPNEILLAILLKPGSIISHKPAPSPSQDQTRTTTETVRTETRIEKETFAGIAGIVAQPQNLIADIGQLLLTPYHRTWVGTETNALLLHHLLDPPCVTSRRQSDIFEADGQAGHDEGQVQRQYSSGDLGLRRVQWQANASNQASLNAALRLDFRFEGTLRWAAVLPWEKDGDKGPGLGASELKHEQEAQARQRDVVENRTGSRTVSGDGVAYTSMKGDDQKDILRRENKMNERKLVGEIQGGRPSLPQGWDQKKEGQYGPGRHTAMLAICWDDWRYGGVREKVDALVGR